MTSRTRITTLIIMAVCAVALIGWDIYAAVNSTDGDTISEITAGFVQEYMGVGIAVVWAIGLLCGHLFWPQFRKKR
jgi:hypothetical protein